MINIFLYYICKFLIFLISFVYWRAWELRRKIERKLNKYYNGSLIETLCNQLSLMLWRIMWKSKDTRSVYKFQKWVAWLPGRLPNYFSRTHAKVG